MKRKRKLHLGVAPIGGPAVKSLRVARKVTSAFHQLKRQLNTLESEAIVPNDIAALEKKKKKIESALIDMEDRYQQASQISTEHHKTARWVIRTTDQIGLREIFNSKMLNVLEIGAVNTQLQQCSWMTVRAIDLNSQHPSIEELDFFTLLPAAEYHLLVSSMVINFVPDAMKRGEMLMRMALHLRPGGLLCLVLPLRCVRSPAVGMSWFQRLLTGLSLEEALPVRLTPKLAFFVLRKQQHLSPSPSPLSSHNDGNKNELKKRRTQTDSFEELYLNIPDEVRSHFSLETHRQYLAGGGKKDNFAIILPTTA